MEENMHFKKYDKVFTADDIHLGDVLRIHFRQDGVNPELRLYASYLEVWSVEFATRFFVPTDYIDEYDAAAGKIYLTETMQTVQVETWDRTPSFIAGNLSRRQELSVAVS